jgi:hypothetical protein
MFNVVFYVILFCLVLFCLGIDPFSIFLSLSSVVLAFAFMIGKSSASFIEGCVFILVRRPYSIGDVIHISNIEQDTSLNGSVGWVVENITLFETTAIWTATKERCSYSNSSLANSRIINGARSPQAQFLISLQFPIDTPYQKIQVYKSSVEGYMKARPREWLSINSFRLISIVTDKGYFEYRLVAQHRESWQHIGQIMESKATLCSFCLEVSKQLNMHFTAPPVPVDIRYSAPASVDEIETDQDTLAREDAFRSRLMSIDRLFPKDPNSR